jgi:hypothetical protein
MRHKTLILTVILLVVYLLTVATAAAQGPGGQQIRQFRTGGPFWNPQYQTMFAVNPGETIYLQQGNLAVSAYPVQGPPIGLNRYDCAEPLIGFTNVLVNGQGGSSYLGGSNRAEGIQEMDLVYDNATLLYTNDNGQIYVGVR